MAFAMKTAFCCCRTPLRMASLMLLFIYLFILFKTMLFLLVLLPASKDITTIEIDGFNKNKISEENRSYKGEILIVLLLTVVIFFIFVAAVVSIYQKKRTHIHITLNMVIIILLLFAIAAVYAAFTVKVNFPSDNGSVKGRYDKNAEYFSNIIHKSRSKHSKSTKKYNDRSYRSSEVSLYIACFLSVAFNVYSACVMHSYNEELKHPQPSVIFGPVQTNLAPYPSTAMYNVTFFSPQQNPNIVTYPQQPSHPQPAAHLP